MLNYWSMFKELMFACLALTPGVEAGVERLQQVVERVAPEKAEAAVPLQRRLINSAERLSCELQEHAQACLSGEETIKDYPWLVNVIRLCEQKSLPALVEVVQALIEAGADVNQVEESDRITPLFALCKSACEEKLPAIKALLAAGADPNMATNSGWLPLHFCVAQGEVEVVRELLAAGVKVNTQSKNVLPLIFYVLVQAQPEMLQLLLESGVDLNEKNDDDGLTVVEYALGCRGERSVLPAQGVHKIVAKLLEAGAAAPRAEVCPPLRYACCMGDEAAVEKLLAEGAEVKAGDGLLQCAILSGNASLCAKLLAAGADVNDGDESRERPLSLACLCVDVKMVEMLLAAGAEVNRLSERSGSYPLNCTLLRMRAFNAGDDEQNKESCLKIFHKLLAAGADMNAAPSFGSGVLGQAMALTKMPEVLEELLAAGAKPTVDAMISYIPGKEEMAAYKRLLAMGVDVNALSESGGLMLGVAAQWGSAELCRALIEAGADVNAKNGSGNMPLHQASFAETPEVYRVLLEAGADPNAKDAWGNSPMTQAIHSRSPELCKLLLAAGANPNEEEGGRRLLSMAAERRAYDICEVLIDAGAALDDEMEVGQDVFQSAVSGAQVGLCRKLVQAGLKPKRWRPLHLAAVLGQVDEVKKLLDAGAKVDMLQKRRTPLIYAARMGHTELCRVLIEAGADVNAEDGAGWTPLVAAANAGHVETVRALLAAGAKVNAKNESDLRRAMNSKKAEIVLDFIAAGADVNEHGSYSSAPLHHAIGMRLKPSVIRAMVAAGADVNAQDDDGDTPLHWLLRRNESRSLSNPISRILLEAGADMELRNKKGVSPKNILESDTVVLDSFFEFLDTF